MEVQSVLESIQIADFVVNMAFQATLILFVSQIVRWLCVKCSAPARSDLCLVTMLLLLALPCVSLVPYPVTRSKIHLAQFTEKPWDAGKAILNRGKPSLPFVGAISRNSVKDPLESSHAEIGRPVAPQAQDERREFGWLQSVLSKVRLTHGINFLGIFWLLGTLLMLARLGHGLNCVRTLRSELTPVASPRLRPILRAVLRIFGVKRPPELYASALTNTPHTIGLLAPCILLPAALCRTASDEEFKSILLHEMSHIAHNDQWAGVLQRLVTALFWWNPLAHSLSADFSQQREYICDNYAIRHGNPRVFATCLFSLAKQARELKVLPSTLCAVTSKSGLEQRIKAILSGQGRSLKTRSTKTAFLFGFVVAFLLSGALTRISWTMAVQETALETLVRAATFPFLADPIQVEIDDDSLYLVEKHAIYVLNREDYALRETIRPKNLSIRHIDAQSEHIVVTGAHVVLAFDKQTGELTREHRDRDHTLMQVQPLGQQWVGFYTEGSLEKPAIALCDSAVDTCEKLLDIEAHCNWEAGTCNDFKTPWGFGASLDRLVVAPDAEFRILIFDERGQQRSEIFRDDIERIAISEEFKELYRAVKEQQYPSDTATLEFSEYFPALAAIKVADEKIYAATYKQRNGKWECFIYDLDGAYLGTVSVPVKQSWPGIDAGTIGIKDGKLYELAREDQQWSLYISELEQN